MDNTQMGSPMGRTSALDYFHKLEGSFGNGMGQQDTAGGNGKQIYWYVFGVRTGKKALLGPYKARDDAVNAARERMSGWTYRTIGLPTRNRAAAVQMLKHDIAKGGAAAQALQAMRHTV